MRFNTAFYLHFIPACLTLLQCFNTISGLWNPLKLSKCCILNCILFPCNYKCTYSLLLTILFLSLSNMCLWWKVISGTLVAGIYRSFYFARTVFAQWNKIEPIGLVNWLLTEYILFGSFKKFCSILAIMSRDFPFKEFESN